MNWAAAPAAACCFLMTMMHWLPGFFWWSLQVVVAKPNNTLGACDVFDVHIVKNFGHSGSGIRPRFTVSAPLDRLRLCSHAQPFSCSIGAGGVQTVGSGGGFTGQSARRPPRPRWTSEQFHGVLLDEAGVPRNKGFNRPAWCTFTTGEVEFNSYEFAGTGPGFIPPPLRSPARSCPAARRDGGALGGLAARCPARPLPPRAQPRGARPAAAGVGGLRGVMIAKFQEELDWECYRLYGLLGDDLTQRPKSAKGGGGKTKKTFTPVRAHARLSPSRSQATRRSRSSWRGRSRGEIPIHLV